MTLLTAFSFPALAGSVFVLEGIQQWFIGSTGAVPVRILVLLLAMLLFVQTPLVFLGSFYGFKKEQPPQVCLTQWDLFVCGGRENTSFLFFFYTVFFYGFKNERPPWFAAQQFCPSRP